MIGDILKDLRKQRNMTQAELAKLLKVSTSTVGMYEQNFRNINRKTLMQLSTIFNVSPLVFLSDSPQNDLKGVGAKIHSLLIEQNLTQRALSEKVGITEVAIGRYINGEREPKATILAKIATALNMPLDYFFEELDSINDNSLGSKLRALRFKNNLTQKEVASKLGLNNKTLNGYEHNISQPNYEVITELAKFYNTTIDILVDTTKNINLIGPSEKVEKNFIASKAKDHFPMILKQLRHQSNLTQDDLAKKLGLVRTSISNYESGVSCPDLDTLDKIATLFNISTDHLLEKNSPEIISTSKSSYLGNILRQLRYHSNLSQYELANILEVDRTSISKYECGEQLPEIPTLKKLSTYFNISIDYLLDNSNLAFNKNAFLLNAEVLLSHSSDRERDKIYKTFCEIYFKTKNL